MLLVAVLVLSILVLIYFAFFFFQKKGFFTTSRKSKPSEAYESSMSKPEITADQFGGPSTGKKRVYMTSKGIREYEVNQLGNPILVQ